MFPPPLTPGHGRSFGDSDTHRRVCLHSLRAKLARIAALPGSEYLAVALIPMDKWGGTFGEGGGQLVADFVSCHKRFHH